MFFVLLPMSFKTIHPPNGNSRHYDKFQQGCFAKVLKYKRTLWKTCNVDLPKELPKSFTYLLIFCHINNTFQLWETFKWYLTEDFRCSGIDNEEYGKRFLAHIVFTYIKAPKEDLGRF